MMSWSELQKNLTGEWMGDNLLRLSWLTPSDYHSPSRLIVTSLVKGKFLSFAYTWSHEDVPHEGLVLLAFQEDAGVATAAWVDSWHQSARIMSCQGRLDPDGSVSVRGSYEAPPGPDWGWRITIAAGDGQGLRITMHNCSPDGTEDLAVQADYTRVP
jgi:hypothetical protein